MLLTLWAEAKDPGNAFLLEIALGLSFTSFAPLSVVSHVDLKRQDTIFQTCPVSFNKGNPQSLRISRPLRRSFQSDKHLSAGPVLGAGDTEMKKAEPLLQAAQLLIDEKENETKTRTNRIIS